MSEQLEDSRKLLERLKRFKKECAEMAQDDYRDLRKSYDELSSALEDLIAIQDNVIVEETERLEARKKRKARD